VPPGSPGIARRTVQAIGKAARKNIGSGYSPTALPTFTGSSVAVKATSRFVDSISDPGMILFIAGLLTFWVNDSITYPALAIGMAAFFMVYSGFFILKGQGMITIILFLIWYLFLGGVRDINAIRFFIVPFFLLGMIIHAFANKLSHNSFREGLVGELKGAFIPILFFFLDIGLIDFLTNYGLRIDGIAKNLLNFTPWWAFFGLATTRKDNALITTCKFFMIAYIFAMLFVGFPTVVYGQDSQTVPGAEELFQASLERRSEAKAENPLISQLRCLPAGADYSECLKERQLQSQAEANCKNNGVSPNDLGWQDCVDNEKEVLQKTPLRSTDDASRVDYLKAEFVRVDFNTFPSPTYEKQENFPATLIIENPNRQNLGVEVNCGFQKGSKTVTGEVVLNGKQVTSYSTNRGKESLKIFCKPSEPLSEGRYALKIETTLMNIVTDSSLKRAFVKNDIYREKFEDAIKSSAFSVFDAGSSKSPAEFARLNFAFGNFERDPIIVADQPVSFDASIENIGRGKVSRIRTYLFSSLIEEGFFATSGDLNCLQGGDTIFPKSSRSFHLASCFLELPSHLREFNDDYLVETFVAELVYDYTLEQDTGIQILEAVS